MKIIKKSAAVLCAAALVTACVPFLSGCSAKINFTLNERGGEKYYTVSCSGYSDSLKGEYEIPAYYGEGDSYAPVRAIATEGFAGTGLTKITVPATVTQIGAMAFGYNYRLKEVVFGDGIELAEFNNGLFYYCSALESVDIPESVNTIWHNAFDSCTRLTSVTLHEGLEKIGNRAFQYCSGLEEIIFPQTLTTIGYEAFYFTSLKSVIIPDSVRDTQEVSVNADGEEVTANIPAIGYCAFHNCTQMTLAVIGGGVENILAGTFGYCTSLESVYLPASLKKVEGALYINGSLYCGHAFHSNTSLTDVYYAGSEEEWNTLKQNIDGTKLTQSGSTSDNSALLNATVHYNQSY